MSKKIVFVVAQNNFQDKELLDSKNVLESRDIKSIVAAKTRNRATGKLGTEIEPALALAEVKAKNFDALVFVGGPGATSYFNDEIALQLVRDFKELNKVVGAICIAPSILANAGILISKTVTAFSSEEQNLRNRGAEYTGMPVEVDGRIVTARDPGAAIEFGEKLAYLLSE